MKRPVRREELVVDAETSLRMAGIRQKDTSAEQIVREILRRLGHSYRVSNRDLPGSPDAANRSRRWAVFVHGCFWHSHTRCPRATVPKRNRRFWAEKFEANRKRDAHAIAALRRLGYRVVVIWECEAEKRAASVTRRLDSKLETSTLRATRSGSRSPARAAGS
jgi:DNA mismatch endonuclease (patch repair protein)